MVAVIVSKLPELGAARRAAGASSTGLALRRCSTAALIAFFNLPPFIVTLGSLTAVRGFARLLGDDTTVFNPQLPFAFIGNGQPVRHARGSSIIAFAW